VLPAAYHKGFDSRGVTVPKEQRRFIAWDGEGMNLRGVDHPQSYVLFGASTGDIVTGDNLNTLQLCEFIVNVGSRYPGAWHIGFAFTYDANMILKSLTLQSLRKMYRQGFIHVGDYCITLRSGKSLTITRYGKNYSKTNTKDKVTVRIFDIFSFFGKSFVASVEEYLGVDAAGLDLVKEGKQQRGTFTDMAYVEKYWRAEIDLLERLAYELRSRMYSAGLYISQWHGPGALGSYAMKHNGIKSHLKPQSDQIREAARYAYAGGRFELFKVGRITGPIWSVDINSAYPYAIARLPSLNKGVWKHIRKPTRIARFGVYRIRLAAKSGFARPPGPVFHRDKRHNISYPWLVDGWYWAPEVAGLLGSEYVEIIEGYEYLGSQERPFKWVEEMYLQRLEWKNAGNPAQIALKLCLNSMYGKLAQRVGWDEKTRRIPPWHQLEYAGWVTSYTRAMLYKIMKRIPFEDLIAVETDGIYTTKNPAELGITTSKNLGGWEVTEYDEVIYLQSGLAFLRRDNVWETKRRGLDKDSFTIQDAITYTNTLGPNEHWEPFTAKMTRFVGLGAALMTERSTPVKQRHCRWETTDRLIIPGEKGKRVHVPSLCDACSKGFTAYEQAHDLVIRSLSEVGVMSSPHSIPWENPDQADEEWREMQDITDQMIGMF
jgi:hypothetical protein